MGLERLWERGQVGNRMEVIFVAMSPVATIAVGAMLEVAGVLSGPEAESGRRAG